MVDTLGVATGLAGSPARALAGVTGLRAIRHPLFVLGALIAGLMTFRPWIDGSAPHQQWQSQTQLELNVGWTTLYICTFLVGHAMAGLDRSTAARELFRATPVDNAARTRALLLAGIAPTGIALSLGVVYGQLVDRAGGFVVGETIGGISRELSIADTFSPAFVTLAAYSAGVALARLNPARAIALAVAAMFWLAALVPYWIWTFPWLQLFAPHGSSVAAVAVDSADQARQQGWPGVAHDVELGWFGLAEAPWLGLAHLVYVLGVAICLAAVALRRSASNSPKLALTGIGAIGIGVVGQLVAQALVAAAYPPP